MDLCSLLLPDPTNLQLQSWQIDASDPSLTFSLCSQTCPVPCPTCGTPAERVHSHYQRILADLPWGEHAVRHHLRVRRMFCDNTRCNRRIFTERLPGVAKPWARRTQRSAKRLTSIGLALGGNAGACLGLEVGLAASRNTLLRLIRQAPLPQPAQPAALGVDDWAIRKRHHYGTVLVDLERRRPLALLPGRAAEPLTAWLREHPGVEVIARDRSGPYARGAREGAPEAVQVADRFHLLQNLGEALEAALAGKLRTVAVEGSVTPGSLVVPPREPIQRSRATAEAAWRQRRAIYEQVWSLRKAGVAVGEIAQHLGVARATVFRHLGRTAPPELTRRADAGNSMLDRWAEKVLAHWNAGQYHGRKLHRALQDEGYEGSYASLARYLRRLRQATGGDLRSRSRTKPSAIVRQRPLTPRAVACAVLRTPDQDPANRAVVEALRRHSASWRELIEIAQAFAALIRSRDAAQLDPWLRRAQDSPVPALRRFAEKLLADYDAVRAAVSLSWSTGPVEGHINRLKLLKRQMYGRANLDLLERRFLLAA